MENRIRKILIFLLLCFVLNPLFSQERNNFSQRLEWTEDDYAFKYKVEIRLRGNVAPEEGMAIGGGRAAAESNESQFFQTVDNYIDVNLPAGNYEYRVYAFDFLGKEASVSDWVRFSVIRAKTPVIQQLSTNVVVSSENYTNFEIPLDVSSITRDTKVVLINNATNAVINGTLEIVEENGRVIASKAVFPQVPEGDWHAKITNPSGLYSETPSILVEKTVEEAREVARTVPRRIYIPSERDLQDEQTHLREIQEQENARIAEAEQILLEEQARLAETQRLEEIRLAEEQRLAEENRLAEELRIQEEERRNEELAYQEYLREEQERQEAAAAAERQRIEEEIRQLAELAQQETEETRRRYYEAETIEEEIAVLQEELQLTQQAIAAATEEEAAELPILEERADLLEQRIVLAENAARLAAIAASYSAESLRITNNLVTVSEEDSVLTTIDNLKNQKDDADKASDLAQETFERVQRERQEMDKKLMASQKVLDKKIAKTIRNQRPAKNINFLIGGDVIYSPYDGQLLSFLSVPVTGALDFQFEWTPFNLKDNLLGFNFNFDITSIFDNNSQVSVVIPVMHAQLGLDYKQKIVEECFYADFTLAGGLTTLGKSVKYESELRADESMHFYLYPCATASAGLYWIPAKHFAVEAGAKFTHMFITNMPTGMVEGYLLMGLRL